MPSAHDVLLSVLGRADVSGAQSALLLASDAGDVATVEKILNYRKPSSIGSSIARPLFRPEDARGMVCVCVCLYVPVCVCVRAHALM